MLSFGMSSFFFFANLAAFTILLAGDIRNAAHRESWLNQRSEARSMVSIALPNKGYRMSLLSPSWGLSI